MNITNNFIKARILSWLIEEDRIACETLWKNKCPYCKQGILHRGCWQGKVDLPKEFEAPNDFNLRFSFCCSNRDCRRRVTPVSLRFPPCGKYSTVILLLVKLMRLPNSEKTKREIAKYFSISPATVRRWIKRFRDFCEIKSKWKMEINARFQMGDRGFDAFWTCLRLITKDITEQFKLLLKQCHRLWSEWNCRYKCQPQAMALLKF